MGSSVDDLVDAGVVDFILEGPQDHRSMGIVSLVPLPCKLFVSLFTTLLTPGTIGSMVTKLTP